MENSDNNKVQALWNFIFAALWFNCYVIAMPIVVEEDGISFFFINLISAVCLAASIYLTANGLKNLFK